MRKYILAFAIFLFCGLAIPTMSLAGADDFIFDADTYITLDDVSITLIISDGAEVASMSVYGSYLTVDLESGSSMVLTSNDRSIMSNDGGFTTSCGTSTSTLTLAGTSTVTVTITPSGTCASTGGGGGGAVQQVEPEPEPEPELETTTGEGTVTASGGGTMTATTDEGGEVTIEFPAGAVSADTIITITPVGTADSIAGDPPAGSFMVGGYVYTFSATVDGETVTTFSEEVTLTFTYTDDQIEDIDESTLAVYRWDTDTSEWVALDSVVDTANNTVTATTTQFSEFALMGEELEEEEEEEMTIEELRAMIEELKVLIASAMARLAALLGTSPIVGVPAGFSFDSNLSSEMVSDDVKYLQIVLNSNVDTQVASSDVGSSGNETNYFGSLTKAAVIKFQEKYADEVLTPVGLSAGTGYVGSSTRAKLNSLLGQ